jgi:hypothetical protein
MVHSPSRQSDPASDNPILVARPSYHETLPPAYPQALPSSKLIINLYKAPVTYSVEIN